MNGREYYIALQRAECFDCLCLVFPNSRLLNVLKRMAKVKTYGAVDPSVFYRKEQVKIVQTGVSCMCLAPKKSALETDFFPFRENKRMPIIRTKQVSGAGR